MMLSIRTQDGQHFHTCQCGKDAMFECIATAGRPIILCTNCGHCPYLPDAIEVKVVSPPFPWKQIAKSLPNNGLFFLLAIIGVCLTIEKLLR